MNDKLTKIISEANSKKKADEIKNSVQDEARNSVRKLTSQLEKMTVSQNQMSQSKTEEFKVPISKANHDAVMEFADEAQVQPEYIQSQFFDNSVLSKFTPKVKTEPVDKTDANFDQSSVAESFSSELKNKIRKSKIFPVDQNDSSEIGKSKEEAPSEEDATEWMYQSKPALNKSVAESEANQNYEQENEEKLVKINSDSEDYEDEHYDQIIQSSKFLQMDSVKVTKDRNLKSRSQTVPKIVLSTPNTENEHIIGAFREFME